MRDKFIGKLRCFQASLMVFFILFSGIFGTGINLILKIAEEDCWISAFVTIFLGFIPFYIFLKISASYPNKNIFEIIDYICGKNLGKIINFIIILFSSSFLLLNFWSLTNLISSQFLYKTPQIFVYIIFMIPIVYMLSKKLNVILQSTVLIFFITILLYFITSISLLPQVNILNILPILKNGIAPVIEASFGLTIYCILPLFFISSIPVYYYEDKQNYTKYMIISYFISCLLIFIIPFFIVSVFGIELSQLYQYPEFQILRRISIGGFIERIESTLSVQWIFSLFILIIIGLYFIKTGFYHIFKIKNNFIKITVNFIFLIMIIILGLNTFNNNTIANQFSIKQYPFVCYIFLIFIGFLATIIFIKRKRA